MSDAGLHEFRTREVVAGIQHDIWAHWMRYLFSVALHNPDGSVTISAEHVQRWTRQMETDYAHLSERERESDRDQTDKVLAMINAWESAAQTARLNNPYAITAFTPVSQDDWARLSDLVLAELGHGFDRYAAALMADAWDNCAREIEEMALEAEGNKESDNAWKDASIDELRILYADRLKDLEYEYGLRRAYEDAIKNAMQCAIIHTKMTS